MNSLLFRLAATRLLSARHCLKALPSGRRFLYGGDTTFISQEPFRMHFGFTKATIVSIATIYVGGMLAKHGASWLEENEIFVPDDDDDD